MPSIDTQPGLDSTANLVRYRRHKPEETSLYLIIEQHLPQFLGQIAEHGTHLPRFVTQEFDDYLTCGRLPDSCTGSLDPPPATIKKTCLRINKVRIMNWVSKVMMLFWGLLLSGLCASGAQLKDPSTRLLLQTAAPLRVVEPDDRPNVLFIIVEPTQVDRVAELSRRLAQGWQKALPPRLAE